MQTLKSLLFVINSTQQYVNASILAKKLTQAAAKSGLESKTITIKDSVPNQEFDLVIFIGKLPKNLSTFNAVKFSQIDLGNTSTGISAFKKPR